MQNSALADTISFRDQISTTGPDRRKNERQIATFRLAKLKCEAREGWGFIKNLSPTGMMLGVHPDFDIVGAVSIFLAEDHYLAGQVVWRRADLVGLEFPEAIDINKFLLNRTSALNRTPRLPRVAIDHPVELRFGLRTLSGRICDISPSGICIDLPDPPAPGKQITLLVPNLGEISGKVKWHSNDRIGIAFNARVPMRSLMSWLSVCNPQPIQDENVISVPKIIGRADRQAQHPAAAELYKIIGVDQIGREFLIEAVPSATQAVVHYIATSKYFERVKVTNQNGTELSFVTLRQKEIEARLMLTPQ